MAAVETTRPAPYGAITTYRAINALSNVALMFAGFLVLIGYPALAALSSP